MANLSQQRREKMLAFLETLKEQHSDDDSLIAIGEIEKELKAKKYGLVWEEHEEAVDVQMKTQIPVFTEIKEKEICADENGAYNFLLEGDNLHSLYLLEKTHRGKIDVIYIDPPYNTGKKDDFRYNDAFVVKEDTFRHSKWLSFMAERLKIARKLLSSNGAIFISIDDDEQAALKMLCDDIFGQQNFVASVIWEKKFSPQNDAKWLSDNHDFILVYAANKEVWKPNLLKRTEEMNARYSNPDNDPRGPWTSSDFSVRTFSESGYYPITTPSGKVIYPADSRCWSTNEETFKKLAKDNRIWFGTKGSNVPRIKTYLSEVQQGVVCKTIWTRNEVGDSQEGTRDLKVLFDGKGVFKSPKPVRLIERILKLASKEDSIVLDFFAGSGTTGQAVIELNKQDGGHRRFILCTNNENGICEEVTYQRLKTVITGKRADDSEYSEGIPANLKYFKTDFVDKDSEELSDELLEHIAEMIELEHGIKIDNKKYVMILTDEEMDEFEKNIENFTDLKAVFVNQDILLSAAQQKLLDGLSSYVIPDYYFDFELREAGELW